MFFNTFIILNILLIIAELQAEPLKIVRVDSSRPHLPLIDSSGRERFFHGSNVVVKTFPYHPIIDHFDPVRSFTMKDVEYFKQLNWNVVRLGIMWRGAEPVRSQYNETYFSIMKQIVSMLNDNDIYVLLDFHQDLLSEKFCGEGVPLWAALADRSDFPQPLTPGSFPLERDETPSRLDCGKFPWADFHFAGATSSAFQSLYDNRDGILDALASYWRKIAQEFSQFPNVLGYNLMNEPWAGDIYEKPKLLVPGVADYLNLQPAWEKLNSAIRTLDNDTLVVFEGVTFDNLAYGFTESPGGSEYANRSIFGYHYYKPPRITSPHSAMLLQQKASKKLGCGVFLTEFDTGYNPTVMPSMMEVVRAADVNLLSWMGWAYKCFGNITGDPNIGMVYEHNGSLVSPMAKFLARPYAQAVAGETIMMKFSDHKRRLTLKFRLRKSVAKPTEILYSQPFNFPAGVKVSITPEGHMSWAYAGDNKLLIQPTSIAVDSEIITVVVAEA